MKKIRYITVFAMVPVLLALLAGCGKKAAEIRAVGEDISATTAPVSVTTLPILVSATGSVEPEIRVTVSTRMMGWVRTLHVREGAVVEKGQPLLTIDDIDLKAQRKQVEAGIAEAKAVVANAEKTAERFQNLYEEKSVSKQQLDDVLTGLERARAGLAKARAAREEIMVHMSYLDIMSPISGLVTRRMVEEGDMASPGHPLMVIEQVDRMKIVARLGEKDVNRISVGDLVTVTVPSLDNATFNVEVARVIPSANPGSRTYDAEAYVDNEIGLKSGMFARMDLATGSRRGIMVPSSAIVVRGQLKGIFTVDQDGIAGLRWVRLGDVTGTDVEVISGLNGDETVVTTSSKPLAEGDKVVR